MSIPNPLREKHVAPYALINPNAPTAESLPEGRTPGRPVPPYAPINPNAPTASSQGWTSPAAPQAGYQGTTFSRAEKDAVQNPPSLPQAADPLLRNGVAIPRCEHLRLSGQQCGSPAMRGQKFCYFHDTVRNPYSAGHGVPMPECAVSIQIGLGRVIRCLEGMPETTKTYALMLYALQTASANLKRVREDERIAAETQAAATADAEKAKTESLFEILKRELALEPPPEGTVE